MGKPQCYSNGDAETKSLAPHIANAQYMVFIRLLFRWWLWLSSFMPFQLIEG